MNKRDILQHNVVPEGKKPWLSYDKYLELKRLFEAVPLPSQEDTTGDGRYLSLHRFLKEVAGLEVSKNEAAIHFNAFALIRRGYQVEDITLEEYERLLKLMDGLEKPHLDDMELYDTGGHRDLYTYLTKSMGLSVQPGRGPAWHRAEALIEKYEAESSGGGFSG